MTLIKEDFWALKALQNDDSILPALHGTAFGFVKRRFSVTPNSGGLKRRVAGQRIFVGESSCFVFVLKPKVCMQI